MHIYKYTYIIVNIYIICEYIIYTSDIVMFVSLKGVPPLEDSPGWDSPRYTSSSGWAAPPLRFRTKS